MLKPCDLPIMSAKCATCPFGPAGNQQVRAAVEGRILTEASQLCHHPRLHKRKETHLCRGARDFQLQILHRLDFLPEATDEAWDEKLREVARAKAS